MYEKCVSRLKDDVSVQCGNGFGGNGHHTQVETVNMLPTYVTMHIGCMTFGKREKSHWIFVELYE